MSTVEHIARTVLAECGTDAGHVLAAQWVSERYVELVSTCRFRHLRRIGEVIVPATIDDGTVTLTQGSTTVTPDTAALAKWTSLTDGALVGRSLRAQDAEWQEIVNFQNGVMTLKTARVQTSIIGTPYQISARAVPLATDARWLSDTMVHMRTRCPIENQPPTALDLSTPARDWVTQPPRCWAEVGSLADGTRLVEFYPYPSVDELVHYVYWQVPPTLAFTDQIPRQIDDHVLKEGALINAMRYMASQSAASGKMDMAAYWRNEYRSQETSWKRFIQQAARTDRGVDDVTFILGSYGSRRSPYDRDITTAYDYVWSR